MRKPSASAHPARQPRRRDRSPPSAVAADPPHQPQRRTRPPPTPPFPTHLSSFHPPQGRFQVHGQRCKRRRTYLLHSLCLHPNQLRQRLVKNRAPTSASSAHPQPRNAGRRCLGRALRANRAASAGMDAPFPDRARLKARLRSLAGWTRPRPGGPPLTRNRHSPTARAESRLTPPSLPAGTSSWFSSPPPKW